MKKVLKGTLIYAGALMLISVVNNIVLLNIHDFSYYYTAEGLRLAAIVTAIEALAIVPLSKLFFMKFMGKEEFHRVFGDKDES